MSRRTETSFAIHRAAACVTEKCLAAVRGNPLSSALACARPYATPVPRRPAIMGWAQHACQVTGSADRSFPQVPNALMCCLAGFATIADGPEPHQFKSGCVSGDPPRRGGFSLPICGIPVPSAHTPARPTSAFVRISIAALLARTISQYAFGGILLSGASVWRPFSGLARQSRALFRRP